MNKPDPKIWTKNGMTTGDILLANGNRKPEPLTTEDVLDMVEDLLRQEKPR